MLPDIQAFAQNFVREEEVMRRFVISVIFPSLFQVLFILTVSISWGSPGVTSAWKILEEPPYCEGMAAPDEFVATAIDSGGNVVAVSSFGIIAKYSSHGSRLWIQKLNGENVSLYACDEGEQRLGWVPTDVVIDDLDQIYILGLKKHDSSDEWVNRLFLMKLQPNGSTVWVEDVAAYENGAELVGLPPSSRPKMRLWTPDAGGTYLVIGPGLEGNTGFFCFDLSGNLVWHKDDGSPAGPFDLDGHTLFKAHLVEYPTDSGSYVLDMAIDVCPVTPNSVTGSALSCNTIEISSSQGTQAADSFINRGDLICSAHTGRASKVFMLSTTHYSITNSRYNNNFALGSIKYNPGTGQYEAFRIRFWSRGNTAIFEDFGCGLALTPQGNIWMTGSWWYDPIAAGTRHIYLAKINPEGRLLSQYDYGSLNKFSWAWAASNEVATDRNGSPVIAGYDQNEDGDNRLFLASDTDMLSIYHYVKPAYQFSIFDPVSPTTGNYADTAVDLNYPTAGIPLALVRTYASRFSDQSGHLGFGWFLNLLDMYVLGDPAGFDDRAKVVWGDGHVGEYINSGRESSDDSTTINFTRLGQLDQTLVLTGHQDSTSSYFMLYNKKLDRTVVFAHAEGDHWYPTSMFKGQTEDGPGAFPLHFTYGDEEIVVQDVTSGRSITFSLDESGRVVQAQGSAGEVVQYQYDANGTLAQVTLADGTTIQYSYDSSHRLTMIRQGDATLLENTYDEKGRVIQQKDAKNHNTTFAYDEENRTATVTSPDGLVTTYAYDKHFHLLSVTDGAGHKKTFSYDEAGRLVGVTMPDGSTISYTYDEAGHITSKTDASGHTTTFTYDSQGHLTSVQRPGGETVSFGYTGDLFSSWINPLGGNYTLSHYDNNKLSSLTDPLGHAVTYSYDDQGMIQAKTGRDGKTVSYTRDAAGRVMTKSRNSGAETVTYAYDALGRVTSVSSSRGTVTYTYNRGIKATETGIFGKTVSYTYDGTSLVSITAGDFSVTSQRDQVGRPTRVTDSFGHTLTYTYDALKRLSSVNGPAGVEVSYHYGDSGLVDVITFRQGGVPFRTITITRGRGGRIEAVDDDGAPAINRSIPALELSFNQADQIIGAVYDPSGRLIVHGNRTLIYDLEGRLSNAADDEHQSLFSYDPVGRRVDITQDGTEKRIVYAGASPIMELDAANDPTAYLLFGPGISLVIAVNGDINYLLLSDFRKNIIAVLDGEGNIVSQRLYSPYGLVLAETGTWPVPFGFLGEAGIYTEATGLVLTRARAYDPETGRFLTPDPKRPTPGLPESFNRYMYSYADPVNLTDTSGLSPFARCPLWLIPYVNMMPTLHPTNTLNAVAYPPMNSFGSDFSLSLAANYVADATPIYSDRSSESGGGNPQLAPGSTDSDGLLAAFFTMASSAGESEPPPGDPVAAAPGTGYVAGISSVPIIALI